MTLLDRPALLLLLWLALMSVVLFIAMGADKRRARRDAWRVPEARLFLFAALGGAVGGWLRRGVCARRAGKSVPQARAA